MVEFWLFLLLPFKAIGEIIHYLVLVSTNAAKQQVKQMPNSSNLYAFINIVVVTLLEIYNRDLIIYSFL